MFADDPNEGIHSCVTCKKEIKRTFFPLFKKYVIAGACHCDIKRMEEEEKKRIRQYKRMNMERAYHQNIMNDRLKRASFQNFERREGSERLKVAAMKFVESFEDRESGLFFYGRPGNGKSHLMAAIHHELEKQDFVSLFLDCSQLFNIAKGTFKFDSKVSLTDIVNAAVNADLLTLDELGSGALTETEFNDILFPIINGRQGKPTNYTTNLNLSRLKDWFAFDKYKNPLDEDGRLIDRIIGSCDIYENLATSKRQEDALKRLG